VKLFNSTVLVLEPTLHLNLPEESIEVWGAMLLLFGDELVTGTVEA
jgi:hypothetical protein